LAREADPVQRTEDVGAELDAGAELAEFRRLLQHADRKTLARERISGGEAADPTARHQDGQAVRFCHRSSFLARAGGSGAPGQSVVPQSSVPIPKFAIPCGTL